MLHPVLKNSLELGIQQRFVGIANILFWQGHPNIALVQMKIKQVTNTSIKNTKIMSYHGQNNKGFTVWTENPTCPLDFLRKSLSIWLLTWTTKTTRHRCLASFFVIKNAYGVHVLMVMFVRGREEGEREIGER
jgi:hypothetical protein